MNYTVTARSAAGRRDHSHASILAALDHAMSLVAAGLSEVAIVDADGQARTPGALYLDLFAPRAEGVPVAAELPLAA